jgi:hypothetical protein
MDMVTGCQLSTCKRQAGLNKEPRLLRKQERISTSRDPQFHFRPRCHGEECQPRYLLGTIDGTERLASFIEATPAFTKLSTMPHEERRTNLVTKKRESWLSGDNTSLMRNSTGKEEERERETKPNNILVKGPP